VKVLTWALVHPGHWCKTTVPCQGLSRWGLCPWLQCKSKVLQGSWEGLGNEGRRTRVKFWQAPTVIHLEGEDFIIYLHNKEYVVYNFISRKVLMLCKLPAINKVGSWKSCRFTSPLDSRFVLFDLMYWPISLQQGVDPSDKGINRIRLHQVRTQLLPCAGPYSSNALILGPYPTLCHQKTKTGCSHEQSTGPFF
jgi:hypothetical protein